MLSCKHLRGMQPQSRKVLCQLLHSCITKEYITKQQDMQYVTQLREVNLTEKLIQISRFISRIKRHREAYYLVLQTFTRQSFRIKQQKFKHLITSYMPPHKFYKLQLGIIDSQTIKLILQHGNSLHPVPTIKKTKNADVIFDQQLPGPV